ncbi:MAG: hypothetical protein LLF96_06890 [Eubacteriales bacterium]|nr:hypothetical protein [Eubacteriales bacterium]
MVQVNAAPCSALDDASERVLFSSQTDIREAMRYLAKHTSDLLGQMPFVKMLDLANAITLRSQQDKNKPPLHPWNGKNRRRMSHAKRV